MAKSERGVRSVGKSRPAPANAARGRGRPSASKSPPASASALARGDWATDLVFDVREPKLAVSLRLDADVLRFFRAFGAGYQTRINEVLKAFMHAREGAGVTPHVAGAKAARAISNGKRAR
jgi:uncharacterized protein (DUF4415 family)